MLPAHIAVSEASPTGLVYIENRGKRRAGDPCGHKFNGYWRCQFEGKRYQTKTATLDDAVEWVRKKREEIHDSEFMRHS